MLTQGSECKPQDRSSKIKLKYFMHCQYAYIQIPKNHIRKENLFENKVSGRFFVKCFKHQATNISFQKTNHQYFAYTLYSYEKVQYNLLPISINYWLLLGITGFSLIPEKEEKKNNPAPHRQVLAWCCQTGLGYTLPGTHRWVVVFSC